MRIIRKFCVKSLVNIVLFVLFLNWILSFRRMTARKSFDPSVNLLLDENGFFQREIVLNLSGQNLSVFQVFEKFSDKTDEVRKMVLLMESPMNTR